jgi:hypothetical protein
MKLSGGNRPNSAVRYITLMSLVTVILTLVGCSQHESIPTSEEAASADQHLPFDGTSDKAGNFPTGSLTPTAIPAGTPLAVHLRTSLSSATSRPGDSFEAVLDEPIVVRGKIVAPRGASVTGKVLDARAASELKDPGYMRLALIAVSLNGQSLPIQTSSIIVKRGSHAKRNVNEAMGASIGRTSIAHASVSNASISTASISKASTGSLARNGKGTLIGASTGAGGLEVDYATENKDVGVAPERRLTFRLVQPVPLGT